MRKAKPIAWRFLAASVCWLAISHVVWADSLDEQRQRYSQIKQAWDNRQMDAVAQLMPTLRDYPLYPYLQYRQLSENLQNTPAIAVSQFVQSYPTLPLVRSLHSRFVNELARRQDWRGLLAFSPKAPNGQEARCNYYYAEYNTGQARKAFEGAKTIWLTGKNLPAACDNLFTAWRASGSQDPRAYLERIRLAMKAGNTSLVIHLANQLPSDYQTISSNVVALAADPDSVMTFARSTSPTDFTRQMVAAAFASVARQDVENARLMIPSLAQAQKLSDKQVQELNDIVAWRLMGNDVTDEQAQWRDDAIMRSEATDLLARRIRMALGVGDRVGLNTWIARLPMEAKREDEWQYWQADLLLERGRNDEAKEILHNLMKGRGFYPMAAAQRLGEDYPLRVIDSPEASANLTQGPEMARVRELMYWGMDNTARGEWASLVSSRTPSEQAGLARYALNQDWWDLSVQATIAGKLWNNLKERFPLAYMASFKRYASGAVTPGYAMAIARQESAFNPKIRSPVGATGLMQLMPGTAQHTARMYNLNYSSPGQLLDPDTNISLGTAYLQYTLGMFDNNRILASAGYNAGPGRVRTWLGNSGGRIDAIAFIESIPFSETRRYVKNVLAYNSYYQYFMGGKPVLLTDTEWQRRY